MAGAIYVTKLVTAFSAATGAKTVLKLISPSTFKIELLEFYLGMDGVTATAVPATVDIFTSDETSAGTSGETPTTTQIKGRVQAHGMTNGSKFSAEGTTYSLVRSFYVPQFMGSILVQNPLGVEEESPSDAADSIGIRINTTATVNVLAYMKWARA